MATYTQPSPFLAPVGVYELVCWGVAYVVEDDEDDDDDDFFANVVEDDDDDDSFCGHVNVSLSVEVWRRVGHLVEDEETGESGESCESNEPGEISSYPPLPESHHCSLQ